MFPTLLKAKTSMARVFKQETEIFQNNVASTSDLSYLKTPQSYDNSVCHKIFLVIMAITLTNSLFYWAFFNAYDSFALRLLGIFSLFLGVCGLILARISLLYSSLALNMAILLNTVIFLSYQ